MQKTFKITLVTLLFLTLTSQVLGQDRYKILFLNCPSVKIGSKYCKTGDTFLSNQKIFWTEENQAMKVQNSKTFAQKVIVADKSALKQRLSLSELLSKSKGLYSRAGDASTPFQLKETIGGQILLLDSMEYKINMDVDENHFFFISYIFNGQTIYKKLPIKKGLFVIDRSIYTIDGHDITPFSVEISIYYQTDNERLLISDDCYLKILPIEL